MKKRFTFLTAAMLLLSLMVPSLAVWGEQIRTEDVVAYTLTPVSGGDNGYATSSNIDVTDGDITITWNVTGNSTMTPWRIGGKNLSGVNREIYSKDALSDNVTKIKVTHGAASSVTVNSWTVIVSKNSDFSSPVSTLTPAFAANTTTTINRPAGKDWSNCYFKFVYNVTIGGSNKFIEFSKAEFYKEDSGGGTYTVTYNANDGSQNPATHQVTDATSPHKVLNVGNGEGQINFTYAGHVFRHWRTAQDENSGTLYNAGDDMPLSADITLYAIWTSVHNITVNGVLHGTVTGFANPVANNTVVTLTYTPNNGEYYSATFASNDVTITDGTFTMPDNNVTITVTETALPVYTVTFSDGGSLTEVHYGAGVTLPNRTGDGTYSFAGWTTSNIAAETTTAPETILTGTYYPAGNITLYPVYTRSEGSGTVWQKITDFSTVTDGTYALITPDGHAFNGEINSDKIGQATENAFVFDGNGEAVSAPTGTCILTLTSVTGGYTIKNIATNKYLYAIKADTKQLAWKDTETSYWNPYVSYSVAYLQYGANNAYLRTYSNNSFRTYSGASNSAVYFAKQVSNSVTYYISTLSSITVPSFDPESQNFSTASLTVTITANDGCVISYTTDGTNPSSSSTAILTASNSATVTITETTTIRALASDGNDFSAEVSQTYTQVYAVTLMSNGVEKSTEEVVPTESISLSIPDNVPDGFAFMGWTADPSIPNTLVNIEYTPTGNVTLYASFAKIISSSYDKVTSASDMTEGEYIITTYYGSKYYTIKSNTAVSSNPVACEQPVTDNAITGDVTDRTWSFTGTSSAMAIKSTSQNFYLNTTNAAQGVKINTTDTDSWNISFDSTDNYFLMKSTNGGGSRYLSVFLNNNSPQDWRNYSSGTTNSYQQITLFKKNAIVSENYYTSIQELPDGNNEIATVTPADLITVPSNAVLTITGACTGTAENLIIEDGGQLIVPNNAEVAATFRKEMPAAPAEKDDITVTGWKLISSPTNNGTTAGQAYESFASVTNLTASGYLLYNYDEENRMWRSSQTTSSTYDKLNVAQGYLYGNSTGTAIEFTGNVNSAASYSVALSYHSGDNLAGFNLIGNPYSENISNTDITFVKNEENVNPAGGYVLKNDGTWNTKAATSFEPNSGFLVQINAAGYTAVVSKPVHGGKATLANNDYISFTVANSQYEDVTYAWFGKSIPLNKINHRNDEIPMLYIPQNGENYAIAMMDDNTNSFNLNFEAKTTGNYTLRFKANGEFNYLHVIDRLTGEDIDMLVEGEYSFVGSPRDNANRFIVRLGYLPNYSDNGEDIFAYQNGNDIVVSGEGELQIFDVMGRMVSSQRINGVETMYTSSLQDGVYVFRLNEKTQKIVVR